MEAGRDVVLAEAEGESWLQRNWRPLTILNAAAILFNNYVLVPRLKAFGIETVAVLTIPDGMWSLLTIGLGGYIVGRTVEKIESGINVRMGREPS